jgi:hypothetical protein
MKTVLIVPVGNGNVEMKFHNLKFNAWILPSSWTSIEFKSFLEQEKEKIKYIKENVKYLEL